MSALVSDLVRRSEQVVLAVAAAGESFRPLPDYRVWVVLHEGARAVAVEWSWTKVRSRLPEIYHQLRQALRGKTDHVIYLPAQGAVEVVRLGREGSAT